MRKSDEAGVGNAATRRAVLIGSGTGAGMLAVLPGIALSQQPVQGSATLAPTSARTPGICPRSFGASGDGQVRFLSDRFGTLAEARAVYPFAERLEQSLDWAGIQAALDAAEPGGGAVVIPVGRFIISDTLRLPSGITLQGESRNGSVIDNQNWALDAPQLANKDSVAFLYVTIRDLTLNGGTHALKVDASREVAGIVIDGVTTNLQTEANLEFSTLQTCVIRDCHLMDGRFSLHVRGFPCNSVHLINTRLGRHSDAFVRLRGVDGFVMLGGSMEAGVTAGKATIDIETGGAYAQAITFESVYFETTHEILLRSRGASGIGFTACKFTGTGAAPGGGPGVYRFDCADDLVSFTNNFFHVPMTGPANSLMAGNNHNLQPGGTVWQQRDAGRAVLASRSFTVAQAREGLFTVALAEGARRVWGRMELFLDPGEGEPLRRVLVPLDFVLRPTSARSVPARSIASGPVDILQHEGGVRLALGNAAAAGGVHALWFTLDLSQSGSPAMNVSVL